jgi:hypothetical protein
MAGKFLDCRKVVDLGRICVKKTCIFCDFLSFFCKKRALFAIFCAIFVFFAISLTILGGVRVFSLFWSMGGGRFLKMGELVKMGKISLSRGVFCFRGFFAKVAQSLSEVAGV